MTVRQLLVDALAAGSLLVMALSVVGALWAPTTFARLHYVTPVTSIATPLFIAAVVLDSRWGITAGLEIAIGVLLFGSGPLLQVAIGRVAAQRQDVVQPESPP